MKYPFGFNFITINVMFGLSRCLSELFNNYPWKTSSQIPLNTSFVCRQMFELDPFGYPLLQKNLANKSFFRAMQNRQPVFKFEFGQKKPNICPDFLVAFNLANLCQTFILFRCHNISRLFFLIQFTLNAKQRS